jgi:type II secretory pathway component GspD/PulD (secretin)
MRTSFIKTLRRISRIGWLGSALLFLPPALSAQATSRLANDVLELSKQPASARLAENVAPSPEMQESKEIARLEALPAVQIPIEDANLASAIKLIAQSAGMNHIAPSAEDFAEPISMSATINPWRLLQLLSERYRFSMRFQDGMWLFSRESAGALIAKTYEFKHANLDAYKSSNANTTQPAAGYNSGADANSRNQGQGFTLVYTVDSSSVIEHVRELIGLPPLASQTVVSTDGKIPDQSSIQHLATGGRSEETDQKVIYLPNTNSLYVVCYRSQHEHVAEYVRQVDQPPVQIRIEARFFATGRDPQRLFGVDYSMAQPTLTLDDRNLADRSQIDLQRATDRRWPPQAILSSSALSVQLNALESDTETEKIDNPFVVTTSNHEALFSVGKEEPFLDSSTLSPGAVDGGLGSTTNRISVKRIGTAVNVVPTYFKGQPGEKPKIRLVVKMELGRLEGYRQVTPQVSYPVVDSQKYEFTVTIDEGQALAFGGLTGLLNSKKETRVPVLGRIPVLGGLFRHENDVGQQRNLIGYIIPTVVRAADMAPEVALKTKP